MNIDSGIRVNNHTEKTIRVRLCHVGPLHEKIIKPGQFSHFDRIGNVFFTVSVEECFDENDKLHAAEIALPIVATVLGSLGGTALVGAGLALAAVALPLLGVGAGTSIAVGSGVVVGSTMSATTGIVAGTVSSGIAIGTGLTASTGVGVGTGVVVGSGVGIGTAVVAGTSTSAAIGASVMGLGGLVAGASAIAGPYLPKLANHIKKNNNTTTRKTDKTKMYWVRSNGTDINIAELNGKFTITKL